MYVLEWNQSNDGLHIQALDRAVMSNRSAFTDNRRINYVPVSVGTREEMASLADELRPLLRMRAMSKIECARGKSFDAWLLRRQDDTPANGAPDSGAI